MPGVNPVTTVFEMVPLVILSEGSIWLAVLYGGNVPGASEEARRVNIMNAPAPPDT